MNTTLQDEALEQARKIMMGCDRAMGLAAREGRAIEAGEAFIGAALLRAKAEEAEFIGSYAHFDSSQAELNARRDDLRAAADALEGR